MTRRRHLLAAALLSPLTARLALAAPGRDGDGRFVFVILRGGLDGLAAVPVPGDPAHASARGALAAEAPAPLPLQGPYALHPALSQLHAMYTAGDAAVLHAVGLAYHERSHFDGQQVLESGGTRPFELSTGWLGRALAVNGDQGLALSAAVPLTLRGRDGVDSWAPSNQPEPAADLLQRLERLYAGRDAALAAALASARRLRADGAMPASDAPGDAMAGGAGAKGTAADLARKAGEFLSQPAGPRAAVLELNGWDTHANQLPTLAASLAVLDASLAALRDALQAGNAWSKTVIVVATEFGRTVAANGTRGTDHGSGAAGFVLGGAVQGGRVVADWPGLAPAARFEGRDLRTTTDWRAVLAPLLGDHMRVPQAALHRTVFPGAGASSSGPQLLRA